MTSDSTVKKNRTRCSNPAKPLPCDGGRSSGRGGPGLTSSHGRNQVRHKEIIDKIRKLLRLSQSANVHEAAVAAAKAQELLAKYNLAQESASLADDAPEARRIFKKTRIRLENWAYILARGSADAFDCKYYHKEETGETVFVGVGVDPEICGWMYGYLYKALLRLASAHLRSPSCSRLSSNKSRKAARDSFLRGAVSMIIHRLTEQKHITPVTCDALVVSKAKAIEALLPEIVSTKMNLGKVREHDWYTGAYAAHAVPLSTPLKSARPACLALD